MCLQGRKRGSEGKKEQSKHFLQEKSGPGYRTNHGTGSCSLNFPVCKLLGKKKNQSFGGKKKFKCMDWGKGERRRRRRRRRRVLLLCDIHME